MVSQAYYFIVWEQPWNKILTYKIQFPFKNYFTFKEAYAVGGHCIVSHILLCSYSIAVWFRWLRELPDKNRKVWKIPGERITWIHPECSSPYCALVYCAPPSAMFCFRFPRCTKKSLLCYSRGLLRDCEFIQHASELLCVVPWISTCVVAICQNYCQMSRKLCWVSKCEGRGEWRSEICSFFDSLCTGCHGRLQNTKRRECHTILHCKVFYSTQTTLHHPLTGLTKSEKILPGNPSTPMILTTQDW